MVDEILYPIRIRVTSEIKLFENIEILCTYVKRIINKCAPRDWSYFFLDRTKITIISITTTCL